ncbi:MAG: prepilin-type N-terminal cleavage/methylation domain-containing protein [Candidatus Ratteibacteria bacterium]|jgi:prepilin-type N-terminal cleavage/methylation domain-containing protein
MKKRDCCKNEIAALNYARNDTAPPPRLPRQGGGYKKGFTLIEMLTTTAIMVIVFGLLALIFGRATTIHKVVRSGGDAENFGIYLINTIIYGPGTNREEGLIGVENVIHPENSFDATFTGLDPTVASEAGINYPPINPPDQRFCGPYLYLGFKTKGSAKNILYRMAIANTTTAYSIYRDNGVNYDFADIGANYFDLKPTWAKDRQLQVLNTSGFYYYKIDASGNPQPITDAINDPIYFVGIKLVLKSILQNTQEAVTLYRCVRIRNQIDF